MQIAPDCMASLLLAIGRLCSLCLLDHRKRHAAVNRPAHTKSFATRDWIPMTRSQSCSDGYSCHAHAARSLPGAKPIVLAQHAIRACPISTKMMRSGTRKKRCVNEGLPASKDRVRVAVSDCVSSIARSWVGLRISRRRFARCRDGRVPRQSPV